MRNNILQTILNAKNSTGIGSVILVEDFRHINLVIATAGMGVGDSIVVKVQGSMSADAPAFGSAKSVTNLWDYIDAKEMENTVDFDGDTGITFTDSSDVRQFSVNVDGLRWLSLEVTTLSDTTNTSITAKAKLYND